MNYNRRKFIKTLVLGTGSLFVPSFSFSNTTQFFKKDNPVFLDLKRKALEAFHRREYNKAETLYKDLIIKKPTDITCYDGLVRIYYKKAEYLKAVDVFREGLEKNKKIPVFYDRLARCLIKLSLGNLKQEMEYIASTGNHFVIKEGIGLYLEAIHMEPNKKYLREGLLDAVKSLEKKNKLQVDKQLPLFVLETQTSEAIRLQTLAYKAIWDKTRNSNKQQFQNLDEKHLLNALESCEKKSRRKIYFDDEYQSRHSEIRKRKAKYFQSLLLLSISNNNLKSVNQYYNAIREVTTNNSFSKGRVVHFYKRTSAYSNLQRLYEKEIEQKNNSVWSEICLAQILLKKGDGIDRSREIFNNAKRDTEPELSKIQGAISHGLAKCNFLLKQYNQGRTFLLEGMNTLVVGGVVNSLIINYAESFFEEKKYEEARNILLRLSGEENVSCNEQIESVLTEMHKFQEERNCSLLTDNQSVKRTKGQSKQQNISSNEELKMLYSLAKMYEKLGDSNLYVDTLNKIRRIDPNDKFLKNRN